MKKSVFLKHEKLNLKNFDQGLAEDFLPNESVFLSIDFIGAYGYLGHHLHSASNHLDAHQPNPALHSNGNVAVYVKDVSAILLI